MNWDTSGRIIFTSRSLFVGFTIYNIECLCPDPPNTAIVWYKYLKDGYPYRPLIIFLKRELLYAWWINIQRLNNCCTTGPISDKIKSAWIPHLRFCVWSLEHICDAGKSYFSVSCRCMIQRKQWSDVKFVSNAQNSSTKSTVICWLLAKSKEMTSSS